MSIPLQEWQMKLLKRSCVCNRKEKEKKKTYYELLSSFLKSKSVVTRNRLPEHPTRCTAEIMWMTAIVISPWGTAPNSQSLTALTAFIFILADFIHKSIIYGINCSLVKIIRPVLGQGIWFFAITNKRLQLYVDLTAQGLRTYLGLHWPRLVVAGLMLASRHLTGA